jgi:hypothetical protein
VIAALVVAGLWLYYRAKKHNLKTEAVSGTPKDHYEIYNETTVASHINVYPDVDRYHEVKEIGGGLACPDKVEQVDGRLKGESECECGEAVRKES